MVFPIHLYGDKVCECSIQSIDGSTTWRANIDHIYRQAFNGLVSIETQTLPILHNKMDVNEFGNDEEAPTAATDPELLITESYMAFTLQFREQYNQKSADYKRKCLLAYYNDTRLDYIPASVRAINQWPPIPAKGTTEEQSGKKPGLSLQNNFFHCEIFTTTKDYIVKKGIIDKLNDERVDCLFENIIDYEMLSLIGSLLEGELVQDAVKANVRKYADYRTLRHLVTQTRDRLCDVLYTIRFKLLKGVDGGWFEDDDIRGLSISTDYKRSWDASPISIQEVSIERIRSFIDLSNKSLLINT